MPTTIRRVVLMVFKDGLGYESEVIDEKELILDRPNSPQSRSLVNLASMVGGKEILEQGRHKEGWLSFLFTETGGRSLVDGDYRLIVIDGFDQRHDLLPDKSGEQRLPQELLDLHASPLADTSST